MENEKGIFLASEEDSLAKFLDSLFFFTDIFKKKLLGVFNVGKIFEKYDRVFWKALLSWMDDCFFAGKLSADTITILKRLKEYIIANDVVAFDTCLAEFLSKKVIFLKTDSDEEQCILGALTMINGLTNNLTAELIEKFKDAVAAEK